ncbi:hypothetical protein PPYR_03496 [Photinus pyralis]|uniref:Citrate transporter-like domain-containing protein n=1 Tax=Photinus pyralis TaxID=7054 RepID=A0A1Y1LF60_PHOPY|nr:protein I'm not dead yet-like [Photinus pyralis]XP_031330830.1 protein I'm not dead yet-like [Photinus pyralis]XP_031331102.1 protein I'm not dead yet-like [Photinus pyralis]KAB0791695.1 hypothetical protein PPYR_03495 [Photinus pyralis]KAB0791696.1 hypothetical protein PPYR_03496 [Photinus pyralis]
MTSKLVLLREALAIYWRTLFIVFFPLILLPVFIMHNTPDMRCLYVVIVMAGFWVTECLPLPVTALIPMVLFPLMGILDSEATSLAYLKETNMMFIGGLIIAIAVEHCNLHRRLALATILLVGCSPRRLHFGLITVTMFVSMWISNTAAVAMMCPIIDATLKELESQGIGKMYIHPENENEDEPTETKPKPDEKLQPSKVTISYFLGVAYASTIGGLGTIVGSGTNLTFKGIYERFFSESEGLIFTHWIFLNVPIMLITMALTWLWLQVFYLGLFRPKSKDAQCIRVGKQGEYVAQKVIRQKMVEMGPMTFHEISVAILFGIAVLLWFFRQPQFIRGWPTLITNTKVKDATAAMIVVMLLFILPSKSDFVNIFRRNKNARPTEPSPPLVTWKVVQQKLPWGIIFLLGGAFALAEGSQQTKMGKLVASQLGGLRVLGKFGTMAVSTLLASILTEFSSNVAVANVILQVLAELSRDIGVHPLYLMMPAGLACSHAFCLPVGTPPNAIASAACNIPTKQMIIVGIGVNIIAFVVLLVIFPLLAPVVYTDLGEFPQWAWDNTTNHTRT